MHFKYTTMNANNTQEKVISLISHKLRVPSSKIFPYTSLKDDLLLDPIDLLLLIAEIESSFNVYLSPEEVSTIETVEDATGLITKYAVAA